MMLTLEIDEKEKREKFMNDVMDFVDSNADKYKSYISPKKIFEMKSNHIIMISFSIFKIYHHLYNMNVYSTFLSRFIGISKYH